jgi:hypothetical protein
MKATYFKGIARTRFMRNDLRDCKRYSINAAHLLTVCTQSQPRSRLLRFVQRSYRQFLHVVLGQCNYGQAYECGIPCAKRLWTRPYSSAITDKMLAHMRERGRFQQQPAHQQGHSATISHPFWQIKLVGGGRRILEGPPGAGAQALAGARPTKIRSPRSIAALRVPRRARFRCGETPKRAAHFSLVDQGRSFHLNIGGNTTRDRGAVVREHPASTTGPRLQCTALQ